MKIKKVAAMVLAGTLLCTALLTGCGKNEPESESESTAILVVSFGTSYNDSRDITIGAIENAIQDAYPQYEVRRAFTSQIIIDKLKERDGLEIDNVTEALDRAVADGIKTLIVQPTHLMNGYEYTDLADELENYKDKFENISIGEPLLTSDSDFEAVAQAIVEATSSYDDGETAICFMGHGTEADSNSVYAKLQDTLTADGYENYYIGTVEAEPSLDDVIEAIDGKGYKKVILEPLMVVAGDHANNDMAGDDDDSWKSVLESRGYQVECIIKGLGQFESIQKIYVDHVTAAISDL
jgi:sirohydrochlorin cobaltochelatase